MRYVPADREHRFPTCDRVRADHGMNGCEVAADVLGSAAGFLVDLESAAGGGFDETGL